MLLQNVGTYLQVIQKTVADIDLAPLLVKLTSHALEKYVYFKEIADVSWTL